MMRWPVLTDVILTCLLAAAPPARGATFDETPCDLPDAGPAVRQRRSRGPIPPYPAWRPGFPAHHQGLHRSPGAKAKFSPPTAT